MRMKFRLHSRCGGCGVLDSEDTKGPAFWAAERTGRRSRRRQGRGDSSPRAPVGGRGRRGETGNAGARDGGRSVRGLLWRSWQTAET
ncbi:hypothetical protein ACFFX0_13490 [Citricoccus parietis]|uniref:Uncharacterized protein n=1 Tax=Citricoccus parietis TaxID=592307 RepID=A0ABV5FZQ6_9MICC